MNKTKIIICLIAVTLFSCKKEKGARAEHWSNYEGKMNWNNATAKCKSLGMRLPLIDELKTAYAAGVTESWKKDGDDYWSSMPDGDNYVYIIGVDDGSVSNNSSIEALPVRCLHLFIQ